MSTRGTPFVTQTGRTLDDIDIESIASELTSDIDVEVLKSRRRGSPPLAEGVAEVVPVRLDANLRAAIEASANSDHTTTSENIREALRRYLDAT